MRHYIMACAGLLACGTTPDPNAQDKPVIDDFWSTFQADDDTSLPEVQTRMAAALAANPSDGDLAGDLGMSYVYLFTQASSMGPPPPSAGALAAMALTYLQQAVEIAPTWRNYSFLGAAYFGQGIGRMDDAMRTMGRTMLEQSVADGKVFTLLARGDSGHAAPVGDPDFDLAIESYFNYFEQCLGRTLDRSNPDLGGLDDITHATEEPMSSCWNDPHAPHVETSSLLNFGDSLVKAGNLTAAQAAYRAATTRAGFATWEFASVIQTRMTEDLAARAALYQGSDPSKWPPIGAPAHPCTQCHGI